MFYYGSYRQSTLIHSRRPRDGEDGGGDETASGLVCMIMLALS
jgi:hypothetical protein